MPDEALDRRSLPYFSEEHEVLRAQVRRFVKPRSNRKHKLGKTQDLCRAMCCGTWDS